MKRPEQLLRNEFAFPGGGKLQIGKFSRYTTTNDLPRGVIMRVDSTPVISKDFHRQYVTNIAVMIYDKDPRNFERFQWDIEEATNAMVDNNSEVKHAYISGESEGYVENEDIEWIELEIAVMHIVTTQPVLS